VERGPEGRANGWDLRYCYSNVTVSSPLSLEFLAPEQDRVPRIEREDLEALSLAMLILVAVLLLKKAKSRKKVQ
jgi:hypothetical protein